MHNFNKVFNRTFTSLILTLFFSVQLIAATQQQKLVASDGAMDDLFGGSVSISGDYAVVGANQVEINGDRFGAAYVFEFDGNDWIEVIKLIPSQAFENFGASVSISGDMIAVGAPNAAVDNQQLPGNEPQAGVVYLYKRSLNGIWSETHRVFPSDVDGYDKFGTSISLENNQLIVGSPFDDDNVISSGSVYIFDFDGNDWSETQKLTASNPASGDKFGFKVDINGNRAIISSPLSDDASAGIKVGSVYVFENDSQVWNETKILSASDMAEDDSFGIDISLSGNRVLVGAYKNDDTALNTGSAYIFEYSTTTLLWDNGLKLNANDAAANDRFGGAVKVEGNRLLVGAVSNDDGNALGSGSIYSYYYNGNTWDFIELILHTDSPTRFTDAFGNAIDLDNNKAMFGSYFDDGSEGQTFNSGGAYIFDVDIAPIAENDSQTIIEDLGVVFIPVLNNDNDVDGGIKIIESFSQAAHGTVGTQGPNISYSPDSNYCNDGMASDDFTYTLNGGSQATVSITVTCVNDLPEANSDYFSVLEDITVAQLNVLANDSDVDGGGDEILVASVIQPTNGTVSFTSLNVSYQPDANYCNTSLTHDTFSYTLTSGSSTTVDVRVICVNDTPSFNLTGDIVASYNILNNSVNLSVIDFINSISFGPLDENTQQVLDYSVDISSDSNNVINNIDITNQGTLKINFSLNPGVAIISVTLKDNGGTSDGGLDTSNALTFNITFIDEMFKNGFEDVGTAKSNNYLEISKSISNDLSFDQDGSAFLYKNHLFELPVNNSHNQTIEHIKLWMREVNLIKKL
jgi:hypothetical protein